MPLAQRRPTLLKLTLPHPPLSCLQSSPPTTINANTNPVTPVNPRRDNYRPRASIDSWCSTDSGCSAMSCDYDWSSSQVAILYAALDNIPHHLVTPYVGSIPPQGVLQRLARIVKEGKALDEWPHSLKATRLMLHHLATIRTKSSPLANVDEDATPPPEDEPTTPENRRTPASRVALHRRNFSDSSEFDSPRRTLKDNAHLSRASTRLQARADRFFTFHPYAAARPRQSSTPFTPSDPNSVPEPLPIPNRQMLRRTISSTMSPLATVQEGGSVMPMSLTPTFAARTPLHRTSNPCLVGHRVRRSDSFVRPSSMGATVFAETTFAASGIGKAMGAAGGAEFAAPEGVVVQRQTLKRAPSYGVIAQQNKAEGQKAIKKEVPTKAPVMEPKKSRPSSTVQSSKLQGKETTPSPPKLSNVKQVREAKTPPTSARTPKPIISSSPSPTPTATSICSVIESPQSTEASARERSISPSIYSSDEEEKKRAQTIKRFKITHRQPSYLGAPLPSSGFKSPSSSESGNRSKCSSMIGQTITVEEYTWSSMASMDSLDSDVPALSASSSVSALSVQSVDSFRTSASKTEAPAAPVKERRPRKLPSGAPSINTPMTATPARAKKPATKTSVNRTPTIVTTPPPAQSTPTATPTSPSPPRTLRRVGRTPAKLDPSFFASMSSGSKREGLSELSRALSFGTPPESSHMTAPKSSMLGAPFGLDSPFEEKKRKPTGPSSSRQTREKGSPRYLF